MRALLTIATAVISQLFAVDPTTDIFHPVM